MSLKILILLLALILDIISLIKDKHKEYKKLWIKRIFIFLKSAAAIGLFWFATSEYFSQKRESLVNATYGEFGSQRDATTKMPNLVFGGNDTFSGPSIGLSTQPLHPITIWVDNNQLNMDVKINDSKGDGIASINNRSWKIYNSIGIDYNNDDSGFEIITSDQRVIFQINLRENNVLCQAMFCTEYGDCVFIDKSGISSGSGEKGQQRFVLPDSFYIKPLFKYPRDEFLGERIKYYKKK